MAIRIFPARVAIGLPVFADGGVVGLCNPQLHSPIGSFVGGYPYSGFQPSTRLSDDYSL
ncbi:MAG: hypothetical protein IJ442_07500 [Bacteroidaceae bacterium]|nr:hypothetical protein [Bacteroidaceae bacterium]